MYGPFWLGDAQMARLEGQFVTNFLSAHQELATSAA